jgi:Fe-S cluster assembly protein SufD
VLASGTMQDATLVSARTDDDDDDAGSPAAEGVTAAFNRANVLVRLEGQPGWLADLRKAAWEAYEAMPLPTTRLEEWRYTDPSLLKWDRVGLAPLGAPIVDPARMEALFAGREAGSRVLVVNGQIANIELHPDLRERGVIVKSLVEAALDHKALLSQHFSRIVTPATGKFAALNGAFWSGGIFIHVPRGVRLEEPIRILRWIDEPGVAFFPRTLVVAGEGSHVAVVEEFASPDFEAPVFSCGAVEIDAANAADLQYVALQQFGRGVHHLSTQRTVARRDANLDTLVVNLGASVARVDLGASLEGPGSRSDMLGLYFARDGQHFDHETRQDHKVPNASSDLLYKGALGERSRAIFRGLIRVWPDAQRTDAYQTNRNLILARDAEATSLPNLEIEADDVRCSHAATVGQLDEEEMFYIMSRGIPRHEAERLVVFGFYDDVLDRLPLPGVVRELREAIEARIG